MIMYLDPGTGSMALQIVIGALTAIALAFRPLVAAIRRLLGRKNSQANNDDE